MSVNSQTHPALSASQEAVTDGHPRGLHLVHDERCELKPGGPHCQDPTGAELLADAGRPVNDDQRILQVLHRGGMQDIRLDERVNLSIGDLFVLAAPDCLFPFTINGKQYSWPYRMISGAILTKLAAVDHRHEVELVRHGVSVIISPTDLVDLSQAGIEHFKTIAKQHVWEVKVQGVPVFSDKPEIKVADAMTAAGFDTNKGWQIFLIVHGKPKQPLTLESIVDLRTPGIEKIRLMIRNVGNGDGQPTTMRRAFKLLPADIKYLDGLGNRWETVLMEKRRWLVIYDYQVPEGFAPRIVTFALTIPEDYPAAEIDMFYFAPFVTFTNGTEVSSSQVRETIDGVTFQGWSRHRNAPPAWDPSSDNVVTHMALVESCMGKELGE